MPLNINAEMKKLVIMKLNETKRTGGGVSETLAAVCQTLRDLANAEERMTGNTEEAQLLQRMAYELGTARPRFMR